MRGNTVILFSFKQLRISRKDSRTECTHKNSQPASSLLNYLAIQLLQHLYTLSGWQPSTCVYTQTCTHSAAAEAVLVLFTKYEHIFSLLWKCTHRGGEREKKYETRKRSCTSWNRFKPKFHSCTPSSLLLSSEWKFSFNVAIEAMKKRDASKANIMMRASGCSNDGRVYSTSEWR